MSGIGEEMADAIATTVLRHERAMVTRWIVLAETVDDNGERGMWTLYANDMTGWDMLGMLDYAAHQERQLITPRDDA